jgi:hypothetical protein
MHPKAQTKAPSNESALNQPSFPLHLPLPLSLLLPLSFWLSSPKGICFRCLPTAVAVVLPLHLLLVIPEGDLLPLFAVAVAVVLLLLFLLVILRRRRRICFCRCCCLVIPQGPASVIAAGIAFAVASRYAKPWPLHQLWERGFSPWGMLSYPNQDRPRESHKNPTRHNHSAQGR